MNRCNSGEWFINKWLLMINTLHGKLFWSNRTLYFHPLSFLHSKISWVSKIHPHVEKTRTTLCGPWMAPAWYHCCYLTPVNNLAVTTHNHTSLSSYFNQEKWFVSPHWVGWLYSLFLWLYSFSLNNVTSHYIYDYISVSVSVMPLIFLFLLFFLQYGHWIDIKYELRWNPI